jgi:hypothetical protein
MNSSPYKRIPKEELARSQLAVALRFYMQGEEFPAVITLAGAAEEILGKIAQKKGFDPALTATVKDLMKIYKLAWGREATEKDFVSLRNHARNEMKHLCSGQDVSLDYEKEAAQMLSRAFQNFLLCFGSPHPDQCMFTSKKVANWRSKQAAV